MKHLTEKPRKDNGPVRVAFIVQMPEIWDKESPVFEAMLKDERFDPVLLVVPPYDMINDRISEYGAELDFFLSRYGTDRVIKAFEGKWVDIEKLGFEYVFYQRCYETYLPERYHTVNVIKYAKTVYVPYAYHALLDPAEYYQTGFFDYLYLFFCCSDEQKNRQNSIRYKHIESLGYPAFEMVNIVKEDNSRKRALWTPRWTDDPSTGGSTFIKYLKRIEGIKVNNPDTDLWIRPHPLAFQNAVKEGKLSEEEVIAFHDRMSKLGIVMDDNEYVEDTLDSTDILITDFSSIIVFYFMSGRPIVYCADTELDYVPVYRDIIECSYIADNWDDVDSCVRRLLDGDDPLKDRRERESDAFRKKQTNASTRILEYMVHDAGLCT